MAVLVPRHKSIVAYLTSINLPQAAAAVRAEINLGEAFDEATSKKYEGLLEKKWTSVVRLQKKVGYITMPRCHRYPDATIRCPDARDGCGRTTM